MNHPLRSLLFTGFWSLVVLGQSVATAQTESNAFDSGVDVEEIMRRGIALAEQGDHKGALLVYAEAKQAMPGFPGAYIAEGYSLNALEEYGLAIQAFTKALNLGANTFEVFNGRGEAFMERNEIELALNDFNNALELNRSNPAILSNMGHVMANFTRDFESAIRHLDDALALRDDPRDYRDRGLAHAQLREFDESLADLKKAIEIEPGNHENYSTEAQVYLLQEEYEKALEPLTLAIEKYQPEKRTDPEVFINGYLLRAELNRKLASELDDPDARQQYYEAVIRDANTLLDKFVDNPVYVNFVGMAYHRRGMAQRMLEQFSDAIDSFTRAIQKASGTDAPYLSEAYLRRGICWYYQGYTDLARGDFETAGATGSGFQDPRIPLWIGFTYHTEGEYRRAINFYGEAAAKKADFPLAYVNRGRAYVSLKDYDKAIQSFNHAVRVEPSNAENYYLVGMAQSSAGEFEKARDSFKLALLKENRSPKMYLAMANVLRELGRDDLAAQYEEQAQPETQSTP
jgi:tetratricopeptide (TPR) repeat protein